MVMNASPLLSVIIPVYNASSYVRQAVDSALAQTFDNLEVLVIDDGSTDGTVEQLSEIKDCRIRLFSRAHAGVAQSRNFGIRLARGDYIGFLDGDDLWHRDKMSKHVGLMESCPDTDLSFSLSQPINDCGEDCGLPSPMLAEVISSRDLLLENLIRTPSSVLVRREALQSAGSFDPSLVPCEDYDMWIRISRLRPVNIRCINSILTKYRRHPSQLTKNWRRVELSWNRMIQKVGLLDSQTVCETQSRAKSRMYMYYASLAYENAAFRDAVHLMRTGFQSSYRTSLINTRNWALVAAVVSGSLLPKVIHRKLENLCMRWALSLYEDLVKFRKVVSCKRSRL